MLYRLVQETTLVAGLAITGIIAAPVPTNALKLDSDWGSVPNALNHDSKAEQDIIGYCCIMGLSC